MRQQAEGFLVEAMRWLGEDDAAGASGLDGGRAAGAGRRRQRRHARLHRVAAGRPSTRSRPRRTAPSRSSARARDPPDLVLTDVMMPNLDGFGLLAALQEDPATIGVPVIMLSARAGEEGTIEGLEAGRRRLPDQAVRGARAARPRGRQPRARPRPPHARPAAPQPGPDRPGAAARARRQLGDRARDRRDHRLRRAAPGCCG